MLQSLTTPFRLQSSLAYRPVVDGLRAVALLAVLVFHLNPAWIPGGFTGVNVFFVISGFLITGILFRDCANGDLSLLRFYQRRIARLFPSLALVSAVTLFAAWRIYLPEDLAYTGRFLVHALLSTANFRYLSEEGGYFHIAKDAHPFLHCWSLSVEEQFYFLFPTLFLILWKLSRRHLRTALCCTALLSLLLCVRVTGQHPTWAFYMLPTRCWELLAGSILAVAPSVPHTVSFFRKHACTAGVLLILLSYLFVRESDFPGWQAIFPVCGAMLVIFGSDSVGGFFVRVLSHPVLTWIGRVSYSLYLWHWPIYCFVDYQLFSASNALRTLLKLLLTTLLASLSWALVESPSRRFLNESRHRKYAFGFALAVLLFLIPIGSLARYRGYVDCHSTQLPGNGIHFLRPHATATIMLMGDSHASALGTSLRDMAAKDNLNLYVLSMSGEDPLPDTHDHADTWTASLAAVQRIHPDYLVLEYDWSARLATDPTRLRRALALLTPLTQHILLIEQPPVLPMQATREGIRSGYSQPFFEEAQIRTSREQANALVRNSGISAQNILNTDSLFLTSNASIAFLDIQGRQLYSNNTHLSRYGADRVVAWIEQRIAYYQVRSESVSHSDSAR